MTVSQYSAVNANKPGSVDIAYMKTVAEGTLFSNFELIQHGSKAIKPSHTGDTIYIPYYGDQPAAASEMTTLWTADTVTSLVPDKRTGTMKQWGVAYGIMDKTARFSALWDYYEENVKRAAFGVARAFEDEVHAQTILVGSTETTYAATLWCSPDGVTDWGAPTTVNADDRLETDAIAWCRRALRKNKVPGFAKFGRRLIWIASPDAIFQLQTNIQTTSPSFEESSMNMQSVFVDNVVGTLFGFVVIESDYSAYNFTATGATEHGVTDTVEADVNLLFGAQAFYCSPLDEMNLEVIEHPFGSGGAALPLNQLATAGCAGYFGCIAGDMTKRLVRLPVPVVGQTF